MAEREDAPMADEPTPAAAQLEMAALASRVAELERQVAQLSAALPIAELLSAEVPSARLQEPGELTVRPVPQPSDPSWRPPALPQRLMPAPSEPPPVPPFAAARSSTPQTRDSIENRLGAKVFNIIAVVAILIGVSLFLKLAIDRGWLGPAARVLIGLAAGAGIVVWSERFRRRGFAAFSYSLKALGSAVLYLALWAAFHLYQLLPASVALGAMVLVTAWNGFMAWSQDAELLAGYGLVGGFATPLLLSTGGNHEGFLFTYLAAIDLATVLLNRSKPWRRMLLPAFFATVAYFIGWYVSFFHSQVQRLGQPLWVPQMDAEAWETAAFVLVFLAIFAVVSVRGFSTLSSPVAEQAREIVTPVLLPLATAAFVSLALYSVLEDSGQQTMLAWLMVALAAVYLGLARVQATPIGAAVHLASAVVLLTIAIPLKASGHSLTTAWLVEGLVLYWVASRVQAGTEPGAGSPEKILEGLSLGGFALGLVSLAFHWLWHGQQAAFFNADLGSSLVAAGTLAGVAWLAARPAPAAPRREIALVLAFGAIDFVAVLLTLRDIAGSAFYPSGPTAFANADFATAIVGLAILAAVTWVAYRLAKAPEGDNAFRACANVAGATLILFNLAAILSVVREIGALFSRASGEVERSLAISGFLMLYGAALLASGFWRRSAFVRWQGLILLVFTIAKVFLFDVSGLSEGYRVASFLGLGALLLAVSFAYQKDWLALRDPNAGQAKPEDDSRAQWGEP